MGFQEYLHNLPQKFHTEYRKSVATVPLFAETLNKEVPDVLCEKPIILVELLLELLSFKIVKMAQGLLAKKKCARKIVNCYRMFAKSKEVGRW